MTSGLLPRAALSLAAACAIFSVASLSAASAGDADALVKAAEQRRNAAEQRLAERRRVRRQQRSAITRKLQNAYAQLAAVETDAERLEAQVLAAERAVAASATLRARAAERARYLARLLGQAADLAPEDRSDTSDAGDIDAYVAEVDVRVKARLATLDRDTRIRRETGSVLGRSGDARPARFWRVGRATTLAIGLDDEDGLATGFAREDETDLPIIVGPELSADARAALRAAEPGQGGRLPLDVDGALTRVTAEAPTAPTRGLEAGGVFVWPILAVGLLGVLLFAERYYYFALRPAKSDRIPRVLEALRAGEIAVAQAVVTPPKTDVDRVLEAGVLTYHAPRPSREQALETALLREEPGLERGVSLLGAVAGLAPLLGLLGTVTGMISTFDVISTFGTGNPRLLSGGISVALITTQLGLVVAVPAVLAHAWVTRAVARRQALLEEARTAVLSLSAEEAADDRGA